ncbi:MAG: GNAT family N-acetyltransferase [Bacteroidales bacterium]|nr:GNAT family N-acetyltransferase [Bacteroidales bacterium]
MAEVFEVDFDNADHCKAVVELMNHYMEDEMGGQVPHDKYSAQRLIEGLKNHPGKLCIMARHNNKFIGLANCFIGFGTFAAKPFINIHDIVVLKGQRDKGIGRLMLEYINQKARESGCSKITLEVRNDNAAAQHLYKSLGFADCTPPMYFWTKQLD